MSLESLKLRPHDQAGPGALVQLIYRSVSVHGVSSALQMSDILAQARPRNAQLGITGALTAINGDFLQVIEGPRASIDTLLVSLQRDARHTDIRVLEDRPITARAFGGWDMVSPKLIGLDIAQLALLLSVDAQDIDQYIPFLLEAIRRQQQAVTELATPVPAKSSGGVRSRQQPGVVRLEPEA
jgi:hypothetical protein